jgi:uncharacterized protein with ParB-like and HNH nuclease domain
MGEGNAMKTDKTTVYELFEKQRRYVVPLFQRGYVWTREGQWQPLWDDLLAQAAEVARHGASASGHLQKHFLGAVVLNLTHTALRHVPVVEIIDGQQRLTTLQLLLAALRDELASLADEYTRADLARLTQNQGPFANLDERFKVWPTSALQEHLRNVMEGGSAEAVEKRYQGLHRFRYGRWEPPRSSLVEAYFFFVDAIRLYLDDDPEELPLDLIDLPLQDRARIIVDALIRNIHLVTIELDAEDDAQVIFETLNARGEPLTPSDLVRNFIFLTATRESKDVKVLYETMWQDFEESPPGQPFWKQQERAGRLKRSRMDLLLFHYVTFLTGEEFKIGHLYQAFRRWWEREPVRSLDRELQDLKVHATVYRQLLAPEDNTRFGRFSSRLRTLDTTTVYPLVLYLANALGLDSPEFLEIIDDLESYLVRRSVCGYNQKGYNRNFLDWLGKLRAQASPPSRQSLHALLSSSVADSTRWPSNEEFLRNLTSLPLYRTFGPRRTQMLLEAIDFALRGRYAEDVQVKSSLTVEHVMPQWQSDDHWPLDRRPDESEDAARDRRQQMVHHLGNLTLLTQPLNSSVSNGPYAEKRAAIAAQSLLPMNTYFQAVAEWDLAAIELRGRKLAEVALSIWPGP